MERALRQTIGHARCPCSDKLRPNLRPADKLPRQNKVYRSVLGSSAVGAMNEKKPRVSKVKVISNDLLFVMAITIGWIMLSVLTWYAIGR